MHHDALDKARGAIPARVVLEAVDGLVREHAADLVPRARLGGGGGGGGGGDDVGEGEVDLLRGVRAGGVCDAGEGAEDEVDGAHAAAGGSARRGE